MRFPEDVELIGAAPNRNIESPCERVQVLDLDRGSDPGHQGTATNQLVSRKRVPG